MLENLVYLAVPHGACGDNPTSAENQQERLIRDENPQRPYAGHPDRGMKRWSQLHGDMQGR
jgi:hypothetical protein